MWLFLNRQLPLGCWKSETAHQRPKLRENKGDKDAVWMTISNKLPRSTAQWSQAHIINPQISYGLQKHIKGEVQALRLCTGRTAHRGSKAIALPFHDHGARRGWGVSVTPRPLFTPVKDPVPVVQEAGWAPGRVWTGAENLAPTGIRSLDRPARSQSLYRLRYPAHSNTYTVSNLQWKVTLSGIG